MNEYNFRNGEFAPFFEVFLQGQIGYGLMHDHILTWLPHINKANVLFVKYEDMLADLTAEIKRVCLFCILVVCGVGSLEIELSPMDIFHFRLANFLTEQLSKLLITQLDWSTSSKTAPWNR